MFDGCTTLQELNQRRIELVKEGSHDLAYINVLYMKAKNSLVSTAETYRPIEIVRVPIVQSTEKFVGIPYGGRASKPFTIEFRKDGVYC